MSNEIKLISICFDESNNILLYLICPKINDYEFILHNSILLVHFFEEIFKDKNILFECQSLKNKDALANFFEKYLANHIIDHDDLVKFLKNNSSINP